jgi:hypothetical protein
LGLGEGMGGCLIRRRIRLGLLVVVGRSEVGGCLNWVWVSNAENALAMLAE